MIKVLLIVLSVMCFPLLSWANDAFLISGQSVAGKHPTNDLRVYRWLESSEKLKLAEKVDFPKAGIGGIYELGMLHDKRLFAAVGGWSPALNKGPLTVLKFSQGKIIRHHYMFDLSRFFELYFHETGKIAIQMDGPLGGWLLIDPEIENDKGKLISNNNFYIDYLSPLNSSVQTIEMNVPIFFAFEPSGKVSPNPLKRTSPGFSITGEAKTLLSASSGLFFFASNSELFLDMVGYGKGDMEGKMLFLRKSKKENKWSYHWLPMAHGAVLASDYWRVFQESVWNPDDLEDVRGTHKFGFFHTLKAFWFTATLGGDSEVFDIDEAGWVLYRAGDTLYKARIQTDHLSEPIKLVSDPAIKNVHWGLWAEEAKGAVAKPLATVAGHGR